MVKDFIYEYKKVTNLGELYLIPIDKRLYDVPERPVISNYSTPEEKFSSHYARLEEGWPCIKDTKKAYIYIYEICKKSLKILSWR